MERIFEEMNFLLQSEGFVDSKKMAEIFNVTSRTTHEDINKIEKYLINHNISYERDRHLGIKILGEGKNSLQEILSATENKNYYSREDREHLIIQELLLEKQDTNIKTLMYITKSSRTTVLKDLMKCEIWLNSRNVFVNKKPYYGIYITYKEKYYREAVIEKIISFRKNYDSVSLYKSCKELDFKKYDGKFSKLINKYIKDIDLQLIKRFIDVHEEKENIKFTDISYVRIFLYICVTINRIKSGNSIPNDEFYQSSNINDFYINDYIQKMRKSFMKFKDVDFSEAEMFNLISYIMARNKVYDVEKETNTSERKLVKLFIEKTQSILGVNLLSDESLFEGLVIHMAPTIHRTAYNLPFENPIKDQIIEKYNEVYNACKAASSVFTDEINCNLNDDEISLLTIHVAASIEKLKNKAQTKNAIKIILICSSGIGTSNMVSARLSTEFPELIISNIYSIDELEDVDMENIDFVISTVPTAMKTKKPIVSVSPLINEEDVSLINSIIYMSKAKENINKSKNKLIDQIVSIVNKNQNGFNEENLRKDLEKCLKNYFGEKQEVKGLKSYLNTKNISLNNEKQDWKDSLRIVNQILVKNGCVKEEYLDDMIAGFEEFGLYSEIKEGVVLAHGKISENVIKTGFSFVTFKEGIDFGNDTKPVRLIIGLCADGSGDHLQPIADLSNVLFNDKQNEWLKVSNVEEFINFALK